MYEFGTVLWNVAGGCHGVTVMVVRWMTPMFAAVVLSDGSGSSAWGWQPVHGGPGLDAGFVGLLHCADKRHQWTEKDPHA